MTRTPANTASNVTRSLWFWNLIAKRYSKQAINDETSYKHKLALTQSHLTKDMTVLEFGCGTGSTALLNAPYVARICGIDYSPKMIEIARAKAAASHVPNVSFHIAAIENWPLTDAPYDAVMGMSILHLVLDRVTVLARVRQMLAPGGLFISSTVCLGDMAGLLPRYAVPIASALRILPKLGNVTAKGLAVEMQTAGFEIIESWRPGPDKSVFIVARAL